MSLRNVSLKKCSQLLVAVQKAYLYPCSEQKRSQFSSIVLYLSLFLVLACIQLFFHSYYSSITAQQTSITCDDVRTT